jgi:hypothetical protein
VTPCTLAAAAVVDVTGDVVGVAGEAGSAAGAFGSPVAPLMSVVNSGAVVVVPLCNRYLNCSRFPVRTETGAWPAPGCAGGGPEEPGLGCSGCDSLA